MNRKINTLLLTLFLNNNHYYYYYYKYYYIFWWNEKIYRKKMNFLKRWYDNELLTDDYQLLLTKGYKINWVIIHHFWDPDCWLVTIFCCCHMISMSVMIITVDVVAVTSCLPPDYLDNTSLDFLFATRSAIINPCNNFVPSSPLILYLYHLISSQILFASVTSRGHRVVF